MKKKSIIILAFMLVLAIALNYFAFMGITIGEFRYDSLFGEDVFGNKNKTQTEQVVTEEAPEVEVTEETTEATEETEEATEETEEAVDAETTTEEVAVEETVTEPVAQKEKYVDKGRIRKGIDLAGGSVISFEVDTENENFKLENLTEANMDIVEAIFTTRLNGAGFTEARISRGELGQITVEIPSVFNTDDAVALLGSTAKLSFVNAQGEVVLDGATDIKDAAHRYGQTGAGANSSNYVELTLTSAAVEKFANATDAASKAADGENFIAIMMDDAIISMPMVHERIDSEVCTITGDFDAKSAKTLANQIKSGSLPFDLKVMSQETIGAELGQDALPTSLIAALIGILLVMIFMAIRYRVSGLIADLALLYYIGIVAWVLGIFRINLSLSGIAGIILSIGMAVDANVIIFERLKEELRLGKTVKASVNAGFHKAFSAILDSNITTIITCVVLYLSGIGTVTGFAITLGIGVIVSMLTAIIITRFLLKQVVNLNIKNRNAICAK